MVSSRDLIWKRFDRYSAKTRKSKQNTENGAMGCEAGFEGICDGFLVQSVVLDTDRLPQRKICLSRF